jgi:hypothetical protein
MLNLLLFFWYERPGDLMPCPTTTAWKKVLWVEAGEPSNGEEILDHELDDENGVLRCTLKPDEPMLAYLPPWQPMVSREVRMRQIDQEIADKISGKYTFPLSSAKMTYAERIVHYFGLAIMFFATSSLLIYYFAQRPVNKKMRERQARRWKGMRVSQLRVVEKFLRRLWIVADFWVLPVATCMSSFAAGALVTVVISVHQTCHHDLRLTSSLPCDPQVLRLVLGHRHVRFFCRAAHVLRAAF